MASDCILLVKKCSTWCHDIFTLISHVTALYEVLFAVRDVLVFISTVLIGFDAWLPLVYYLRPFVVITIFSFVGAHVSEVLWFFHHFLRPIYVWIGFLL